MSSTLNEPSNLSRSFTATLAFTICLSAFAIDVCLPAIPLTVQALGAPTNSGQLVVASYLAGYTLGMIPLGLAADRFGRMPIFFIGLFSFIIISLIAAAANSIESLVVARFCQGIAGSCGPVLARAIARDTSSGLALNKLTALLVTTLAISTLVAPLFGSIVIAVWGWRAPYVLNSVMGVISIILVKRYLFETLPAQSKSAQSHTSLARQLMGSLKLFMANRQAVWGTLLVSFTFFGYMGIVAGFASIIVEVYGYQPTAVGYIFAAATIFYVLSAQLGRHFLDRTGSKKQLELGIALNALAFILCALILSSDDVVFWWVWAATTPYLLGMGLVFANATAITLAPMQKIAGFSASILGTVQMGLGTLGAVLTSVNYSMNANSMILTLALGSLVVCGVFISRKAFAIDPWR